MSVAEAITLEQIYADYDVLSKADKEELTKHVDLYRHFMQALKGGSQERRLAAQFLSKFLPNFPQLADEVVNCLIDLLENEDVLIRKQGVIELSACCKANHSLCAKVADVFSQLLITSDAGERTLLSNNLLNLFRLDAKGTLAGIFTQILNGDDEVRHNTIKFVSQKLITSPADTWKGEIEQQMIEYCNKAILGDCTLDEFVGLVRVLAAMPSLSNLQGRQQLVETIADVANLSQPFNPSDREMVVRVMQCTRQALTLFSKNVPSNRFAVYIILNVLPAMSQSEPSEDAVEFSKLAAELTTHLGPIAADQLTPLLDIVYNAVIGHMPMPPSAMTSATPSSDAEAKSETATATSVQADADEKLHFSHAECLLYLLHKLASKQSSFLSSERVAALKPRLQYFAQRNQIAMKQVKLALAGKKPTEIEADEGLHMKQLALRTTSNINTLIIDLLHVPPQFKANIILSWKQTSSEATDEKAALTGGKNAANGSDNNGTSDGAKRAKFQHSSGQHGRSGSANVGGGGRPWRGGRGGRRF